MAAKYLMVAGGGLLAAAMIWNVGRPLLQPALAAESAVMVPKPALDEAGTKPATETAVLAGGCFWGVQGVFQHVKGVTSAVSGYAGGEAGTAQYETVSGGNTGVSEILCKRRRGSKIALSAS